jgi:hypothetical protein
MEEHMFWEPLTFPKLPSRKGLRILDTLKPKYVVTLSHFRHQYEYCYFRELLNTIICIIRKITIHTTLLYVHPFSPAFPKLFSSGTTFISQNVLRTTLLLSALKVNCLRFSTTVCDTQFTLI